MRGQEILDLIGDLDPAYIEAAAQKPRVKKSVWHRWAAMAACFCLLLAMIGVVPNLVQKPVVTPHDITESTHQTDPIQAEGEDSTAPVPTPWDAYFNEVCTLVSADRAYIQAIFTEELDDADLNALRPGYWFDDMACSGYAVFDNHGNLLDVILEVDAVTVRMMADLFQPYRMQTEDLVVSKCGEVEYYIWQYSNEDHVILGADASINGQAVSFMLETTLEEMAQAKVTFQRVLACFAHYGQDKPDLSAIMPDEIPELTDQVFNSLKEAQAEPDFGRYLPSELPDGFEESAIRRFQFQNANYLSAMWSGGMNSLSWVVRSCTTEDANRLTAVQELENYDLSLYPIPRAESVPDELYEIVNDPIFKAEELLLEAVYRRAYKVQDAGDTEGWRMNFSVLYGDILVSVNAKGVDPEWVYQHLIDLNAG